jgi:nicotinamidase-related amidase
MRTHGEEARGLTMSGIAYPIDPSTTALVSIDLQVGFGELEPVPDAGQAVARFRELAAAWRAAAGAVIHVHMAFVSGDDPGRLPDFAPGVAGALAQGAPMTAFYEDVVRPGDLVLRKTRFSAVASSDLVARLQELGADTVIVAGLTTPVCVQTTVDGLTMLGYKVVLAHDACASQPMGPVSAEDAHRAAVERMRYLFARVAGTDELVAEVRRLAAATA